METVCVCVCVCVRARMRACTCACVLKRIRNAAGRMAGISITSLERAWHVSSAHVQLN